jgi:hypothetical protein
MGNYLRESQVILQNAKDLIVNTNQELNKLPGEVDKILQKHGICKNRLRKQAMKRS